MSALVAVPARLWPAPEQDPAAPLRLVLPVLAVGVLGACTLSLESIGLAWTVTGAAALLVGTLVRSRRPEPADLAFAGAALLLLAVLAVRAAEWLQPLCLLGAWALATLSLVGGRTWTGVVVSAAAAALVPVRTVRWFLKPLLRHRLPWAATSRASAVAGVSALLVLVFGALFAAADPAYGRLVGAVVPSWQLPDVTQRLVVLGLVSGVTGLAVYLGQQPPAVDALAPAPGRPVRRSEWVVPLALVDLLFASFVLVQLTVLFGGRRHVLETEGLTYAEYARHGFWQLLVVSALTLVVIAVAVRVAPREERRLVQAMLGALCVLSLVVVASALHRMHLYEDEYGFTRLRLFVQAVELALGAGFLLLLVAGALREARWLPRAAVGIVAVTLLSVAALNPDAWVAERNVDRFQATGKVDVAYLSTLSADAVPALLALPPAKRACALVRIRARLVLHDEPWYGENLGRHRARQLLARELARPCIP